MLTIQENYSLKEHNSFGLDVKARYFVEYESEDDLVQFLAQTDTTSTRLFHIGSGSDLLFTRDFDGYLLHSAIKGIEVLEDKGDSAVLKVGAAVIWDELIKWTINNGYYGLENMSLIPSEVGAAAVQNIGAYGVEVKDYIQSVECVDLHDGRTARFFNEECKFSYRHSIFKDQWHGRYAITKVVFSLPTRFVPNLQYRGLRELPLEGLTAQAVRNKVISLRQGKLPEPAVLGNAGSFFLNPIVSVDKYEALLQQYPDMPHFPVPSSSDSDDTGQFVKVPAAWLIERAGWKGKNIGRAGVYELQPLVLVNRGGATPDEIVTLAATIIDDVNRKFGITLKPEAIYI